MPHNHPFMGEGATTWMPIPLDCRITIVDNKAVVYLISKDSEGKKTAHKLNNVALKWGTDEINYM